jgi:hypothetical protein
MFSSKGIDPISWMTVMLDVLPDGWQRGGPTGAG